MTKLKLTLFNVFDNVHIVVMVLAQISIQVDEILKKKYSIIAINRFLGSFQFLCFIKTNFNKLKLKNGSLILKNYKIQ